MTVWYPELIKGVFSVCTPYVPPSPGGYVPLEEFVKRVPNFRYQVQLAGREVEEGVVGREKTRGFLEGMYGARDGEGRQLFDVAEGVHVERLEGMERSPLLSEEEVEFYVGMYQKRGLKGPLNWYRTGRVNWEEERELVEGGEERVRIGVPSMIVTAKRDEALPPAMTAKMERWFDSLMRREVDAGHWALWQAAGEVNGHIGEFLGGLLGGEQARL